MANQSAGAATAAAATVAATGVMSKRRGSMFDSSMVKLNAVGSSMCTFG